MAGVIRYWIEQTNEYPLYYRSNSGLNGLYIDFLQRLETENGYEPELVTARDGVEISAADALDMLETGDLDIVFGLPEGLNTELICFPVYENVLTAVINKDSPDSAPVENCYWGVDSALLELTRDTTLEGHVLDYNGCSSLFEALDNRSVYGILVRRSLLDNFVNSEKSSDFHEFSGIKLAFTDSIYINASADADLISVTRSTAKELQEQYSPYSIYNSLTVTGIGGNDTLAPYYNKLVDSYHKAELTSILATAGIAAAVVFAALSVWLWRRLKRTRKLNEARLGTLFGEEPDKELFEIDLSSKKIYAYNDFALLGVNPGSIPNPIKLDRLSNILGYNFTEHYAGVSLFGNTIYKNRFILHAGGKKLYIAESGKRTGTILTVTMTLVK
ncbi:MAG: hypothetical protein K6E85_12225 [Lachnospiraceae bacterium]|nr:hypothetical protein [Lachnospiraceae bacterium]